MPMCLTHDDISAFVSSPTPLTERPRDYPLIQAWNLAGEIGRRQAAYRAAGGHFILPIPGVRSIDEEPS